ncbi:MAG: hypothetical protein ACOX8W_06660 [bacterium]|jgi:predicted transcriptional regulator
MTKKFSLEQEMIPPIASCCSELIGNKGPYGVFLECVGAQGIADVVFAGFDSDICELRDKFGLGPLVNLVDVTIMQAINPEGVSEFGEIVSKVSYSSAYVKRSLSILCKNGYIEKNEEGYFRSPFFAPVAKEIIAIEAKREDWAKGIHQARRYLRYANRVFLALDDAYSHRIIDGNLPHLSCIGLLTVNAEDRNTSVIVKPKWRKPSSEVENILLGERLWAILYNKQENKNLGVLHSYSES